MKASAHLQAGDRADVTTIATALPRRRGPSNLRLEVAALRDLSKVLAADPSAALHCALDIARALCHAGSAGLSLIRPNAAHQSMVRWELVRGELASYEGLDTPLASSPCGLCVTAGDAILVSRPVRAFAWLENIRPSIHEELIVPLQDSSGRVEGTLWIAHHEDDRHCSVDDARIVEQLANQIVLARSLQQGARDREQALSILQSLQAAQESLLSHDLSHERSQRHQAEASELEARRELTFKETMIDEVNHRTKNTLHTVAALLSMQARIASSEEVRRALLDSRDRLQLFADVHAMISAGHDKSQTVLMPALLEQLCNALRRSFGNIRPDVSLELSCDPITLPVADAVAIALFSNETVTNAYKHAFSNGSAGEVAVRLQYTPARALVLQITDSGVGADLAHPAGGMGLKLMRSLAAQLHGTFEVARRAGTSGTQVTLTMDRAEDGSISLSH